MKNNNSVISREQVKTCLEVLGLISTVVSIIIFYLKFWFEKNYTDIVSGIIYFIYLLAYFKLLWSIFTCHDNTIKDEVSRTRYVDSAKFLLGFDVLKIWEKIVLNSVAFSALFLPKNSLQTFDNTFKVILLIFLSVSVIFYWSLHFMTKRYQKGEKINNIAYWILAIGLIFPISIAFLPLFILVKTDYNFALGIALIIATALLLWKAYKRMKS